MELASHMSEALDLARQCVRKAQKKQKEYYDTKMRPPSFRVGDRVFLFKPADNTGPPRKFARPYHGPFRVVEMDVNTAKIRRVDRPDEDALLVAVDRLRYCPTEVPDAFWPPARQRGKKQERGANRLQAGDVTHNEVPAKGTAADEGGAQIADSREPGEEVERPETPPNEETESFKQMDKERGPINPKRGGSQEILRGKPTSDLPASSANRVTTEETTVSKKRGGEWSSRLRQKPKKRSPGTCELQRGEM